MLNENPRSLGVLDLERGPSPYSPPPGSMRRSETFDFPVILETVAGACTNVVIRGDPGLEPACVAAAQRLVERGAVAISSACGFFIRHQEAVAAAVDVPVALSSLLLLPTLLRQIPKSSKIAVLTFDSTHCTHDLFSIEDPSAIARIVVGGIEGGKHWQDEMQRQPPPVDVAAIKMDVQASFVRLRAAHPEIAAVLLECTGFPLVAPALRQLAKCPVYDITDLCRLTMASVTSGYFPDVA